MIFLKRFRLTVLKFLYFVVPLSVKAAWLFKIDTLYDKMLDTEKRVKMCFTFYFQCLELRARHWIYGPKCMSLFIDLPLNCKNWTDKNTCYFPLVYWMCMFSHVSEQLIGSCYVKYWWKLMVCRHLTSNHLPINNNQLKMETIFVIVLLSPICKFQGR